MDELELEGTSGISRRDIIKRGAVLGGMVWAAPALSAIGPRAFAQTQGTVFPGTISYVFVWYGCTVDGQKSYFRVKYTSTDTGYSDECGSTGVSQDSPECQTYYNTQEANAAAGEYSFVDDCPPDAVTAGTNSAGQLVINTGGSCEIIGWMLHDGSCNFEGNRCRSPQFPYKEFGDAGSGMVGPTVPSGSGTFVWSKCN